MSARSTLVTGLVFLALLAIHTLDTRSLERERTRQFESERLFTFEIEAIQRVEIQNPNGTFRIERDGEAVAGAIGRWRLVHPIETPADPDQVEPMLRNLQGAKKRHAFRPDGDLASYGLDAPAVRAEIVATHDGKTKTLRIRFGNTAAQTYQTYAQIEGEDEVFVLSDHVKRQCEKDLYLLRDKTVLAAPYDEVVALSVAVRGGAGAQTPTDAGRYALQRASKTTNAKTTAQWVFTDTTRAADTDTVETVLHTLHTAKAMRIVDTPTSPSTHFRVTPETARAMVTITRAAKPNPDAPTETTTTKSTLYIGRTAPNGDDLYAQLEGEIRLLTVRRSLLTEIDRPPDSLRDRRLVEDDRFDIAAIEVRIDDETVEIARPASDAPWAFADGEHPPVSQHKASQLLADLVALRANELLAEPEALDAFDLEAWGLDTPAVEVRLRRFDDEDATDRGFDRGEVDADRGVVYARRLSDGAVLTLDFRRVGDFHKYREDLEDRTFLRFEPETVARLQVEIVTPEGPVSYEFTRRESSWGARTSRGRRVTVQPFQVAEFLDDLVRLEYANPFHPAASDATRGGLETPNIRVRLLDAEGQETDWLAIGQRISFRMVVESDAGMWLIDLTNAETLNRGLRTLLTHVEQSPPESLEAEPET